MSELLRRIHPAVTAVTLAVSLLALVAGAAGVGFAAGSIGTAQLQDRAVTTKKIKNNAVTSKKVKNGSLKAADMVKERRATAPRLSNGGEGDCVWSSAAVAFYGVGPATYRKDRWGRVHMSGFVGRSDGPGGDGNCDGTGPGQVNDMVAFTLPSGFIPARSVLLTLQSSFGIIVGASGLNDGSVTLPPGTVIVLSGDVMSFDTVSFDPVRPTRAAARMRLSGEVTEDFVARLAGVTGAR